jgi:hypothetical protein
MGVPVTEFSLGGKGNLLEDDPSVLGSIGHTNAGCFGHFIMKKGSS